MQPAEQRPFILLAKKLKLRIGLLVDSGDVSKYTIDLARWANAQSELEISTLIIHGGPDDASKGLASSVFVYIRRAGLKRLFSSIGFRVLTYMENKALKRTRHHSDHLARFDITRLVKQSLIVKPIRSKSGFIHRFCEDDVEAVRSLALDLLVRCGSGILRGEILTATRFGIVSFHHGDNRINRGGPAGFWEVYTKQAQSGFVIQQLTEELDGGNVLQRGCFPTKFFYLFNQAVLYTKSNYYLKKLLLDVAKFQRLPPAEAPLPYHGRLFTIPTPTEQVIYVLSVLPRIAEKVVRKFFRRRLRWGVAFARTDWTGLVMWRAKKIRNPPNHFLADPFVVSEGGSDYCFVEDYDFELSRGSIAVYLLSTEGAQRVGVAIEEAFHLSFPYVFRYNSRIYLCPETSENNDIRIYESTNFPTEWKLAKTVMKNVTAVDTMIFEHDGLWWLFTNIDPTDIGELSSELFIFYSSNPLSDAWSAHAKNPVVVDSAVARNAGLVVDGADNIYRVAQKQGFDLYGAGFSINKIITLTRDDYLEVSIQSVEPGFFKNLRGTHHLHSDGQLSAFDFLETSRVIG